MDKTIRAAIEWHGLAEYPREACGLIISESGKQLYIPCRNTATTPSEHFRLSPEDFAAAEDRGEVLAVVHSHPDAPAAASESDRVGCEASGLPWHILEVRPDADGQPQPGELVTLAPAGYRAPLIGRPFAHGVLDCLTLVQDFYARELGIQLQEYARDDDWWNHGQSLYLEHLPAAGFQRVDDLQHGDIVLMQIRSPVPNHAGIYLADGTLKTEPEHHPAPGSILHHLYGKDSRRDVYGGYWGEVAVGYWRHQNAKQPN